MKDLTKYSHLSQFIGAYFHQDWTLDAKSSYEVIDTFIQEDGAASALTVAKEIDSLLSAGPSDVELEEILQVLGSAYHFKADGFSASQWLHHVRVKLNPDCGTGQEGSVLGGSLL